LLRYLKALVAAYKFLHLPRHLKGEFKVLRVHEKAGKLTVTLPARVETRPSGTQSMFWNNRRGHAIVRKVESRQNSDPQFVVEQCFREKPSLGQKVWLSGWLGEKLTDFGLSDSREIQMEDGTLATHLPGDENWVIHVHGRSTAKAETFRNFPAIRGLGWSQLAISHVTDAKPFGLGKRRSHLGNTEWEQIQNAVDWAVDQGAKRIVLFGFSMGTMLISEYLRQGRSTENVVGIVLDSPLVDWHSTLNFQSVQAGLDHTFGTYGLHMIRTSKIFKALRLHEEHIPTALKDFQRPVLLFYSASDGYVSMQKIPMFIELNPGIRSVHFPDGRHCRLYNQDPKRYTSELLSFITSL